MNEWRRLNGDGDALTARRRNRLVSHRRLNIEQQKEKGIWGEEGEPGRGINGRIRSGMTIGLLEELL